MILGILGPGGCGGTFLDWTLQYLSGQTKQFFVDCRLPSRNSIGTCSEIEIVNDPLLVNNAHRHQKTHPNDYSIHAVIEVFRQKTNYDLHSFYYIDGFDNSQRRKLNHTLLIDQYPDVKFINFVFDKPSIDFIFCLQFEKTSRLSTTLYFNQLSTTASIAEQREVLSLFYTNYIATQLQFYPIAAPNVYNLQFKNMLYTLNQSVFEIFNFFDLKINQDRYRLWEKIYCEWQQKSSVDFFQDLDKIVECVVQNKKYPLDVYNMTLAKESVIAKRLLYDYNLSLKMDSSKLEDTQQWTKLLEKNVYHKIQDLK